MKDRENCSEMDDFKSEFLYTQKLYPTINNEDLLEFRIPPNTKGQLDLNNVVLHFLVTLPKADKADEKVCAQNFFAAKQFSSLEIRLNGEAVNRRSCANEYFLASYFTNILNYAIGYLYTGKRPAGIFDFVQQKTSVYLQYDTPIKQQFVSSRRFINSDYKDFEMQMTLDSTLFNTNDLLPSNTAVDLSFERAKSGSSVLLLTNGTMAAAEKPLPLRDCYLLLPFVKDEKMFHLERNAIQRPLKLKFDDYSIKRFNLPKGSSSVMMSDILSGPLPPKIFWAVQSIGCYTGSCKESSTRFERHKMHKANMYIDGNEVSDYPVTMNDLNVTQPFTKFLATANMKNNGYLSQTVLPQEYFEANFIFGASIEENTNGNISFEFIFDDAVTEDLVLIVCSIYDRTIRIDHNRNFQVT